MPRLSEEEVLSNLANMHLLTTPEIQVAYARLVIEHHGEYLKLSDPECYAFYAKRAQTR